MNWCAIETTLPTTPFFASFNLWDTNRQLPKIRHTRPWEKQMLSLGFGSSSNNKGTRKRGTTTSTDSCTRITMKDRSKNRKPLQRGRNLSIEAIQTIQALKRAAAAQDRPCSESLSLSLEGVFSSKFRRLLKLDMMAVLHELLRQNEYLLALKVLSFPLFLILHLYILSAQQFEQNYLLSQLSSSFMKIITHTVTPPACIGTHHLVFFF